MIKINGQNLNGSREKSHFNLIFFLLGLNSQKTFPTEEKINTCMIITCSILPCAFTIWLARLSVEYSFATDTSSSLLVWPSVAIKRSAAFRVQTKGSKDGMMEYENTFNGQEVSYLNSNNWTSLKALPICECHVVNYFSEIQCKHGYHCKS